MRFAKIKENMLPFETTNIFEQLPRFVFKMPRVVPDQESKFQSDELFRRLCRESEVSCLEVFFRAPVINTFFTLVLSLFARIYFIETYSLVMMPI